MHYAGYLLSSNPIHKHKITFPISSLAQHRTGQGILDPPHDLRLERAVPYFDVRHHLDQLDGLNAVAHGPVAPVPIVARKLGAKADMAPAHARPPVHKIPGIVNFIETVIFVQKMNYSTQT